MPDMCCHSQPYRLFVQCFGCGTPAYAAAVFSACMFGNYVFSRNRTKWVYFSNTAGKATNVFQIQLCPPRCCSCTSQFSGIFIGSTLFFGLLKCFVFDKC